MFTNRVNGKRYVGKTQDLKARTCAHRTAAARGKADQVLYRAMRKYGTSAFCLEVLGTFATDQEALDAEVRFVRALNTKVPAGYNMTDGGEGMSGHTCKRSPETRAKLSAIKKGRKLTPEHRAKIAEGGRGRSPSAETRAKLSAAHRGRAKSPEHCANMSKAQMGKTLSPEHIAKVAAAQRGSKRSEETRAKMAVSNKAAWVLRRAKAEALKNSSFQESP